MREEDDQLYIYKLYGLSTPRRIKADKSLRARIGPNATITEAQIEKAQMAIDDSHVDFKPYALSYVSKIEQAVGMIRAESYAREDDYNLIINPLIQIKGQAGMFGNQLISEVSAMVLKFLEHYQKLDNDMLAFLDIYCQSVRMSYDRQLTRIDSPGGRVLINELSIAMERYRQRFNHRTGR